MSATTPSHILYSVYNQARGIGRGPIVKLAEYQTYMLDLDGWFTWCGTYVDIHAKSLGAGLYEMQGTIR